jgi:hypothetical protein
MDPAAPQPPSQDSVLITGLPRSGTTMTCWLLNQLNAVVALHEPIQFAAYPETESISSILHHFIRETRAQLLRDGTAPSHAMQGRIESNPVSSSSSADPSRRVIHQHQIVAFTHVNSESFQLAIKHNAPFTAQLDQLEKHYTLAIIIRNPLALLCSWQTVPLPIREGRLPMGERYDESLRTCLSKLDDPLHRQIAILDWCFAKYQHAAHVYKYEDLIATGGRVLSSLFPSAKDLNVTLSSRNQNPLYPLHLSPSLANCLFDRSEAWRTFYTEEDILALVNHATESVTET